MSQVWFPQQLKTILNRDELKIMLPEQIGYQEIKETLIKSQHVGLTTFNEECPMSIVCLTTDEGIYFFDLDESKDRKFLKEQFKNDNIQFYMDNGSYNALLFYEKVGIRLYNYRNIFDLTVLDLLNSLNQARILNRDHIYETGLIDKRGPVQFNYENLVKYRLGADKLDFSYSNEELLTLKSDPCSSVAKNLITKRTSLKRALGEKLIHKSNEILDRINEDFLSFAKRATSDIMIRYENEKDGSYSQFCQYLQLCPKPDYD